MLNYEQWEEQKRKFLMPGLVERATGRTFRALLRAALHASEGNNVLVLCHTHYIARDTSTRFMDTFHNWGFYYTGPATIRQEHSNGRVLFRSIGESYDFYRRICCGINYYEIYDV